jgi:hypothetical protein
MMSLTVWTCRVLSPVAMPDRWPTALASVCSRTVATCLTTLPAQSC